MAKAAILVIGNEILSGRTRDLNVSYLASELAALGVPVAEVRIVRDEYPAIIAGIEALRHTYTYVFTSGGIGPTHDDITSAAVAEAFGLPLERHEEAVRRLTSGREGEAAPSLLKMADLPRGASLIDNPLSQAPGFRLDNVFVLAGVPDVLRAMFETLRPIVRSGPPLVSRSVTLAGYEDAIADRLTALQAAYPEIEIGSYPTFAAEGARVAVVASGYDPEELEQVATAVRTLAAAAGVAVIPTP